jgi:ABC-type Na+ efflux pump permease subunit
LDRGFWGSLGRSWAITFRDLEDAVRNSTFLLILVGPVICSILFFQLSTDDDFGKPRLGLVGSRQEGLGLVLSTSDSVLITSLSRVEEAQVELDKETIDGFMVLDPTLAEDIKSDNFPTLTLHVVETESLRSRLLERAIENSARQLADQEIPVDLQVKGEIARKGDASWAEGLLPSWLVFTAMSGLMFCSASIIEEKDHGTLLGVLTAPVSMVELWIGKVGSGVILSFLSTLAVLLGNGIIPSTYLLLHLTAGCLAFAALGLLVGLLSSNGATANAATSTLFMVIYIPLALQEMSVLFYRVASFTPAFYLQRGTRYLMDGHMLSGLTDFGILAAFGMCFALLGLGATRNRSRILAGT